MYYAVMFGNYWGISLFYFLNVYHLYKTCAMVDTEIRDNNSAFMDLTV